MRGRRRVVETSRCAGKKGVAQNGGNGKGHVPRLAWAWAWHLRGGGGRGCATRAGSCESALTKSYSEDRCSLAQVAGADTVVYEWCFENKEGVTLEGAGPAATLDRIWSVGLERPIAWSGLATGMGTRTVGYGCGCGYGYDPRSPKKKPRPSPKSFDR
ncbi:hypothetical protein BSKO_09016 [Bryopsis sp. KO-2023]|nr:hypothetical protein BSKO_09016 [Bryopsis sp. KO-2023]